MPVIDKSYNLHYIDCVFSHFINISWDIHVLKENLYYKIRAKKFVSMSLQYKSTLYHMSPSRRLCCYCSIILVLFNWRLVRGTVECKITFQFCGEEGGRTVVKFCLGNQLIFSLRNRCELAIVWQTHQDLLIRLSLTLVQEKQSKLHLCKINTSKIF